MRRQGKWTRIHREGMNPYMFDGVRCEACKVCFGLPTPYCPNGGAKMQDNVDFEVGILVEVVRCKDCKHMKYAIDKAKNGMCGVHSALIIMNGNDYCSYGERKEE